MSITLEQLLEKLENLKEARSYYNKAFEACRKDLFDRKFSEFMELYKDRNAACVAVTSYMEEHLNESIYYERYLNYKKKYEELAFCQIDELCKDSK